MKVGQLAQKKGASPGVREFGATLASDHQSANQSATQVAQQLNITPPGLGEVDREVTYGNRALPPGPLFTPVPGA